VAVEIVTLPNGEPPAGGLKMPRTVSCSVRPVTVVSANCEPSRRSCFSAYSSSRIAPSVPSSPSADCDPLCQSKLSTVGACVSTAVIGIVSSNARPCPPRTLDVASTPGTFATVAATVGGSGLKLFCAATA
jgi:hypothetical protein